MDENKEVLLVTTADVQGRKVLETLGLVYGSSVRSRTISGNIVGQVRAMFGGRQRGYRKLINQARDEAIEDLRDAARKLGANGVLSLRFDSGEFDADENNKGSMQETTAYGTAVVLEPKPTQEPPENR